MLELGTRKLETLVLHHEYNATSHGWLSDTEMLISGHSAAALVVKENQVTGEVEELLLVQTAGPEVEEDAGCVLRTPFMLIANALEQRVP